MRRLLVSFVLAGFLPLMGCETLQGVTDSVGLTSSQPQIVLNPGPICPATGVLSDAASVTKLKPGTSAAMPKPDDVVFRAEMSQAKLDCSYDRAANTLTVSIKFAVRAARGPAAAGMDPRLPFFVAIVDADNNILAKSVFNSEPQMEGHASALYTETVSKFPVPLMMDHQPSDYEILTGFQLTPDELAYNRIPKAIPAAKTQTR